MRIYNSTSSTSLLHHSNTPLGQEKWKQCFGGYINRMTDVLALVFAWPPAVTNPAIISASAVKSILYQAVMWLLRLLLQATAWIITPPMDFHPAAQTLWQQNRAALHTAALTGQNHNALRNYSSKYQPTHSTSPRANHCITLSSLVVWVSTSFCVFLTLFPWSHRYPR